ncbi:MAG: hypothetical protein M5U28_30295 [Sandaracinaceae bacterium]|nr:hypothetical protein [Sandaracinaceae bacterium]
MASDSTEQPCARCGAPIDPVFALMTGDGPVCKLCENRQLATDARASASSSSFGPLGWGVVSLFCNVLFIPSILAITGGIRDLRSVSAARALGVHDASDSDRQTKAIFAIVLGAMHPVLLLCVLGLVVLGGVVGALTAARYDPSDHPRDDYGYEDDYDDYGYDDYDDYGDDDYGDDDYGDDDHGDDDYGETLDDLAAAAPSDTSERRVAHVDGSRPFAEQVRAHAANARSLGLRPYLYAHASWCPPCNAVARHAADPQMVRAFSGTYLIEVDIDLVDDAQMRAAGFRVSGIPAWYGVSPDGRHDGRTITGAAWGPDVPANMAPPLTRFFAGEAI